MSRAPVALIVLAMSTLIELAANSASGQTVDAPSVHEAGAREGVAPAQTDQPLDSVAQRPLLSDWGPRRRLADHGVTLTGHFIGETAVNDRGYRSAGWDYIQQIDFGAVLDLAKLGAGEGTVKVLFSDRLGNGLQADRTGAYIQNQAFYGQGKNFRFDELSYERLFLDKRLSLKGGFYAMGNEFAGLPDVCNFNNNGHCGHPLGILYGSGWVDSVTGQWGGRVKWTDPSGWYAETGIYDVTPLRKTQAYGLELGFPQTTGFITPLEVGYVHGKTPADYPGTYKFGIYYDSSTVAILGDTVRQTQGRGGIYVQAAQQLWKPRAGVVQGISVFAVATLNDARTGLFRTYYEAGASWRGLFRSRGDDIASIGWVQANVSSRVRDAQLAASQAVQTDEQLWELNYGVQITPWLVFRPGLQYVIRPSGYSNRPDTIVYTMHLQAAL